MWSILLIHFFLMPCFTKEFVDDNFAVNVKFQGSVDPNSAFENDFSHHFAEEELTKVIEDETVVHHDETSPFDGKTCTAFKLDQLKMGEQARRIANFNSKSKGSN